MGSNSILFSTELHGVKILSSSDSSITKNLFIELLGYKTTATAISEEHKLLAFANSTIIYIVNLTNKTIIQTIKTATGEIEALSFVENSPYIVAGTKEGRVSQYRYDARAQLSRLCSFPHKRENAQKITNNYISTLTFHRGYMACSGYGGGITLMKVSSLADKRLIDSQLGRINILYFLDENHLLSGSADGTVHIYSLKKEGIVHKINTPLTSIKHILKIPKSDYILVGGESNKLTLINTKEAKLSTSSYLTFEANLLQMTLDESGALFAALDNNRLYKFEFPNADELKSYILHNNLDEAFRLIESDPMLRGTREHKRLEMIYEKHLERAIEALTHSQTKEAKKLTAMFEDVASKKEEVKSVFRDFEKYPRFRTLVAENKYALAYVTSEKFPMLKKTPYFKKMEASFKDAFAFAQKQILMGYQNVAEEILSPYASVIVKKPIINLLLKQNSDFMNFLKALQEKNYAHIELLLKKNQLFAQIPTYTALKASQQSSLDAITELISLGKADEAIEQIKELQSFSGAQEELKELYRVAKLAKSLQLSYEEGDFIHCYETIDEHYVLNDMELSRLLEKHWSKLMQECEEFALKGDIKSIKNRLGELIGVKTRLAKLGDLLRVSFHSKIKGLLAKRSFHNAENIIYSYIDIFGIDSELRFLMKAYQKLTTKKLAITLNQEKLVPRDNWTRSPLIMTPSSLR